MKVLALIPTRKFVEPDCLRSINHQTYSDYSVAIHALAPVFLHAEPERNRVLNVVRNRNIMRNMALKTDAEWFFWVDSDTVVPSHAIDTFMKYKKEFMGGWYKKKDNSTWVSGNFNKEGLFVFQKDLPEGLFFKTDLLGLGCAFMHRTVLEKIEFDGGVDRNMDSIDGGKFFFAECAMFSESAQKIGVMPTMIREVICEHIPIQT